jgi:hypothetical protein
MSTTELQNMLIRKILDIKETEVLHKMNHLLEQISQDSQFELSDLEKRFIEIGLEQVENGMYHTNEEVFEKTGKWLEK